jgi:hypothetical protein
MALRVYPVANRTGSLGLQLQRFVRELPPLHAARQNDIGKEQGGFRMIF